MRKLTGSLAAVALLSACQHMPTSPSGPALSIAYPTGVTTDLPHQTPGTIVHLQAVIRANGRPQAGIEVTWDDARVFPSLRPIHAITDSLGVARTDWVIAPLAPGQFSVVRQVVAYLSGAQNNPLTYRMEVVPCTRC